MGYVGGLQLLYFILVLTLVASCIFLQEYFLVSPCSFLDYFLPFLPPLVVSCVFLLVIGSSCPFYFFSSSFIFLTFLAYSMFSCFFWSFLASSCPFLLLLCILVSSGFFFVFLFILLFACLFLHLDLVPFAPFSIILPLLSISIFFFVLFLLVFSCLFLHLVAFCLVQYFVASSLLF